MNKKYLSLDCRGGGVSSIFALVLVLVPHAWGIEIDLSKIKKLAAGREFQLAIDWREEEMDSSLRNRQKIIVAVIDTGAELDHPALRTHLWRGPDGLSGWNFINQNSDLTDRHGHGTHVAGMIAKLAPEAKLMVLKYYEPQTSPEQTLRATIEAFRYAIRNHADVINYSGGGLLPNEEERAVLGEARRAGILVVAAAGNESDNSDRRPFYPANYLLPNILSVGAVGRSGPLVTSNFGLGSVDISSLGENLVSALPQHRWGPMTGTSQATAVVTGAAALWLGQQNRRRTPIEVIDHLTHSGIEMENLVGKNRLSRRLSIRQAMNMRQDSDSAFGLGVVSSEQWITVRPGDLAKRSPATP